MRAARVCKSPPWYPVYYLFRLPANVCARFQSNDAEDLLVNGICREHSHQSRDLPCEWFFDWADLVFTILCCFNTVLPDLSSLSIRKHSSCLGLIWCDSQEPKAVAYQLPTYYCGRLSSKWQDQHWIDSMWMLAWKCSHCHVAESKIIHQFLIDAGLEVRT